MHALKYGPYSPSRLETATCGFGFYHAYVDPERKKQPGGLAAERGSAVHDVLEKVTQKMCTSEAALFSDTEVREWTADAIRRYPAAYQETGEILNMVRLYIQKPPPMLIPDAKTELRLAVKWNAETSAFEECDYDDPQAYARGRADILMISDDLTEAIVIDHKTQPNIEQADTFQMGFYSWVISKYYPFLKKISTILHFVRYGTYSEPYVWTAAQLHEIEDELLTRVAVIEGKEDWSAVPYKNCQYCPVIAKCPALESVITVDESGSWKVKRDNLEVIGDTAKAVQVAGVVNVLEEVVTRAKKNLRDYVSKTGSIAIPGKVYEFRPQSGVDWDKVNKSKREEIWALFEKHKLDPKHFMGFSQTHSGGVWNVQKDMFVKELGDLLPKKTSTRFDSYKI